MIFVANLVLHPVVEEFFYKSVKNWQSSRQSSTTNFDGAVLFGPLCTLSVQSDCAVKTVETSQGLDCRAPVHVGDHRDGIDQLLSGKCALPSALLVIVVVLGTGLHSNSVYACSNTQEHSERQNSAKKKKKNFIYHKLIRQIIRHIAKISMEGCRKARAIGAGHP